MRKRTVRRVWSLVNPINHVLEGREVAGGKKLNMLRLRELAAIEAFRTGKATMQEWCDLVAMLNIAEGMANDGIGPEVLEACKHAQEAMVGAAKRYELTKRMGLTGEGLQAVRELYEYHDLQRTSISLGDYEKAIKKTMNRVRSKAPEVIEIGTV